ncbi:MAG TPA: hypothetical protein VHE30_13915 [Polyangiaceae bacterium]|nr:hypothetical protein [Polyangiaceae bacterium]
MTQNELLRLFPASPDACLHQVDLVARAALLVGFTRETYRSATFLDQRVLGPTLSGAWVPLDDVIQAAARVDGPRPVHFLFHSGHVGSTLVTRLLEDAAGILCLREPLPLRTLADAGDALSTAASLLDEASHAALSEAVLRAWSRGYSDTRAVLVKAPSVTTRVAPRLLGARPAVRAVHLDVTPESYVAGWLARPGIPVDLRAYGPERIRRIESRVRAPLVPLARLSPGELAAMSWLAEALAAAELRAALGARVLSLDFDALLGGVGESVVRVLAHLGVEVADDVPELVARSHWLSVHAKSPGVPYSPAVRRRLLDDARVRHADEVRRGLTYLADLARGEPAVAAVVPR